MPHKFVSLKLSGEALSSFSQLPTTLKPNPQLTVEEPTSVESTPAAEEKKRRRPGPKLVVRRPAASSPAPESPGPLSDVTRAPGRGAANAAGGLLDLDRSGRPAAKWVPYQKEIRSFSGYAMFVTRWRKATGQSVPTTAEPQTRETSVETPVLPPTEIKEESIDTLSSVAV